MFAKANTICSYMQLIPDWVHSYAKQQCVPLYAFSKVDVIRITKGLLEDYQFILFQQIPWAVGRTYRNILRDAYTILLRVWAGFNVSEKSSNPR